MPRNSQGLYTLPAGNPVVPGTLIESTWANTTLDDVGNEITESLPRDGSAPMTAQLTLVDQIADPPLNGRSAISLDYLNAELETIQTGAVGGVGNPLMFENDRYATANYTVTNGKNAMSAGPIAINPGVTIGVPAGSVWSIVGGGSSSGVTIALGDTVPVMDGVGNAGVGTFASRNDHVHPSDTSRAPIASPSFSGIPLAPTAAPGTNSTQIATTAFVLANGGGGGGTPSDALPFMDGTAAPGVDIAYSRGDHVHPSDTTRAPLASPVFTGNPQAPTPTAGDNDNSIATTAFVAAAVVAAGGLLPSNSLPLINGTASAGTGSAASRDDHVHPTDTTRAPLASPVFTGNPTAPTPTAGDADTSIATTAFVAGAIAADTLSLKAANNLSDLNSVSLAQANIQLSNAGQFDAACTDNNFAFTGNANTFSQPQVFDASITEKAVTMAANTIQCNLGSVFSRTVSGDTTFAVSGVAATGKVTSFILNLTNGGSSAVTWWSGVKWAAGVAPTLTAAGRDVLGFFTIDGGTTWSGFMLGKDMK